MKIRVTFDLSEEQRKVLALWTEDPHKPADREDCIALIERMVEQALHPDVMKQRPHYPSCPHSGFFRGGEHLPCTCPAAEA